MRRFGICLIALLASVPAIAGAQCKQADKPVSMQLAISAAPSVAEVTKRIELCTRHEYRFALDAGQFIEIRLDSPSGQPTMLTLVTPSGDKPVDGGTRWAGTVKERGLYTIEIGTDKTTTYTLNVVLR
ncbi:MAG: hypothetical protein KIT16_10355 [Rhodospirillaceae bacterium]|nr:hypothetical protein [Rhodospirillaceae bacterium]